MIFRLPDAAKLFRITIVVILPLGPTLRSWNRKTRLLDYEISLFESITIFTINDVTVFVCY